MSIGTCTHSTCISWSFCQAGNYRLHCKPSYFRNGLALLCPHFGVKVRYLGSHIYLLQLVAAWRLQFYFIQLDPRFFPKFWIGHSNKMLLWWNQKRRLDSKRVGQAQRWANDAFHTCNINLIFQPWNYRQDKFLLNLGQGSIPHISVLNS